MALLLTLHARDPEPRLIRQAVQLLRSGGLLAIPTDTCYALVCHPGDKSAVDRLRRVRQLDERQHLSLLCADLSQLATYAQVDNRQYRLLKLGTPGPFTFILAATKEVPRRLSHPQRRTIGLRVPSHPVAEALLAEMGEPLIASTLIPPGETEPLQSVDDIMERFGTQLDAVIDAEGCPGEPSTVIDIHETTPVLVRSGLGDPGRLGLQL